MKDLLYVYMCVYEGNNWVRGRRQIHLENALPKVLENLGTVWIGSTIYMLLKKVFLWYASAAGRWKYDPVIQKDVIGEYLSEDN